jgi:DNA-binding NarL/FixJ family response regulator
VSELSVLLVDDQELVRAGFRMILESEPGLRVVGVAGDGKAAIAAARRHRPDVVLMDIEMPGMDGIAATRVLAAEGVTVVILTTFERDDYILEAIGAGASGFLLKNAPPEELVAAVRIAADGDALLSPSVTRRVLDRLVTDAPASSAAKTRLSDLTEREVDVLRLLGLGRSNREIAAALFLGEATVKTHVSHLLAKLHLRDRVQAVVFAYESGLVRATGRDPSLG